MRDYQKRLLYRITPSPFLQCFSIVVAELGGLLRGEVLLLGCMQVLLHLFHNMLGLVEILDIQVRRAPGNFLGMAALRAEFPLLETIHVRKSAARRAPDDEVHDNEVIGVIVINKYRRFAEYPADDKTGPAEEVTSAEMASVLDSRSIIHPIGVIISAIRILRTLYSR
jgi:hypothetical protein